jgi:hypothetical protein
LDLQNAFHFVPNQRRACTPRVHPHKAQSQVRARVEHEPDREAQGT